MSVAHFKISLDGKSLPEPLRALLIRVELRESDCEASVAALRFRVAQQPTGEVYPLDEELFRPLARLAVALGAPQGPLEHLFAGYITHVRPHFEEIASACYVEVLAMDAAVLLEAHERVAAYPDATDAEAVEDVFRRYGIPLTTERTPARYEERRQLLVQRGTDWAFIRQLARRNGYCCYLEPEPLSGKVSAYFRPRALEGSPQADLAALHAQAHLRWVDLQRVDTRPVRYAGASVDPIAKRLLRTEGTPSFKALGKTLVADQVEDGLSAAGVSETGGLLREPPTLDAVLQAAGTAATDEAGLALEARGEVDCARWRGLLRARRTVLLKGVGKTFAGTYYVCTVRTTLEEGVLLQSFVALRNATGLSGRESFGKENAS